MKFIAVASLFIAAAMAAPNLPVPLPHFPAPNKCNVGQAQATCGHAHLSCCNKVESFGPTCDADFGVLNGLLPHTLGKDSLGLFSECSSLDVTALIGVNDLLHKHCSQNVVCCQNNAAKAEGGINNIAAPCAASFDSLH